MSEGEDARFNAFRQSTETNERDWIAFLEFERAIQNAASCAGLINLYDGGDEGSRERSALELALGSMLFRVLPRVDLGTLIANVEGVGYALRYGIIEPRADALDSIKDTKDYEALSAKGFAADQADSDRRVEESMAKPIPEDAEE